MQMASLHCSAYPSKSIQGFYRPRVRVDIPCITFFNIGRNASSSHLSIRSKNSARSLLRQRLYPLYASNTDSSEGSNATERSEAGQGPPLLTILAGLLVFLVVCWIIGSIVIWLISLIGILPPSK